jgi:hypothetical protein
MSKTSFELKILALYPGFMSEQGGFYGREYTVARNTFLPCSSSAGIKG